MLTASLTGLARGEVICVPGLDDAALLERLSDTQRTVMMTANKPALAKRYQSPAS